MGRTSKSDTENSAPPDAFALRRVAFTIPEFCYRNAISRVTYHRLRAQGRGPVELRFGLNSIRITAEAERDWQHSLQQPDPELQIKATARAVRAGDAAVKSDNHISKRGARNANPPDGGPPHVRAKRRSAAKTPR